MKARCHKNGGQCGYFTDGKVYDVRVPYISRRLGEVIDDRGHSRVIPLDGAVCAHITQGYVAWQRHTCVGTWEIITPKRMNLTDVLWTRVTPWDVHVSFTSEVAPGLHILTCQVAEDAERIVHEHNAPLVCTCARRGAFDGHRAFCPAAPENCRDCGTPFNNANPGPNGRCGECNA